MNLTFYLACYIGYGMTSATIFNTEKEARDHLDLDNEHSDSTREVHPIKLSIDTEGNLLKPVHIELE